MFETEEEVAVSFFPIVFLGFLKFLRKSTVGYIEEFLEQSFQNCILLVHF